MGVINMKNIVIVILILLCSISVSNAQTQSIISIDEINMEKDSTGVVPIEIEVMDESGLGAATIELSYDPEVIQILKFSYSDFDSLTYNINSKIGLVNIVTYQAGLNGIGPGTITFGKVELKAIGAKGSKSLLSIDIITLKNNTGFSIPYNIVDGSVNINGDFQSGEITHSGIITDSNSSDVPPNWGEVIAETATEPPEFVTNNTDQTTDSKKSEDVQENETKSTPAFSFLLSTFFILFLTIVLKRRYQGDM